MKLIFVARNALLAYLISSAVATFVITNGTSIRFSGLYRSFRIAIASVVLGADHDAVGAQEVLDGAALAQELRVRRDRAAHAAAAGGSRASVIDAAHPLGGASTGTVLLVTTTL